MGKLRCPVCGKLLDPRGVTGHAKTHEADLSKEDFEMAVSDHKPVVEADSEEEVLDHIGDAEEIVGVADDAIIMRREIIITDPEIKERIADRLVEMQF